MAFEAGGKVAQATIEALKSQPVALALVLINVIFLITGGFMFHELAESSRQNRAATYKLLTAMVERNCVMP
jgi:hypothetical protein